MSRPSASHVKRGHTDICKALAAREIDRTTSRYGVSLRGNDHSLSAASPSLHLPPDDPNVPSRPTCTSRSLPSVPSCTLPRLACSVEAGAVLGPTRQRTGPSARAGVLAGSAEAVERGPTAADRLEGAAKGLGNGGASGEGLMLVFGRGTGWMGGTTWTGGRGVGVGKVVLDGDAGEDVRASDVRIGRTGRVMAGQTGTRAHEKGGGCQLY